MPTATPPKLKNMTAVSKDSKIKPLGYIVWFSVPDEPVAIRKLRHTWGLAGLETALIPKDQRAVNVFKRAVRELEKSPSGNFTDPVSGLRTETDVRDVLENEQDVIYEVTRVTRDESTDRRHGEGVSYSKGLRVWFSKVTEEIGFRPLEGMTRKEVLPIMDEITAVFDANAKSVTGAKVRTLVRSYIKDDTDERDGSVGLSGENLRGKAGGVYFVLAKHREKLDSLVEFLSTIYEPGRAYLYYVPLADGRSEREMIRARHVDNCIKDMEREQATVRELLRDGRERGVRENVAKHHWTQLRKFERRAAEYANALQAEQDSLETHMDVLRVQLNSLI